MIKRNDKKTLCKVNYNISEKLWLPVVIDGLVDFEGIEEGQAQFGCTIDSKPSPEIVW